MITKSQYLANPCRAASLPYWKAKSMVLPEEILIVHDDDFRPLEYAQYTDEPYFRLFHSLKHLYPPQMPEGFCLCNIALKEFADHINSCYDDIGVSEAELHRYTTCPVYNDALWIALQDRESGAVAATGIAELDKETGEGILEWIQVSRAYRGRGLGRYLVSELLWRMRDAADFVTVSGQCGNPSNPERLYRTCGFTGTDVWHILRESLV